MGVERRVRESLEKKAERPPGPRVPAGTDVLPQGTQRREAGLMHCAEWPEQGGPGL